MVLVWWSLLSPQQKLNLSTALMGFQHERLAARLNMLEALTNEGEAQTEEIKATFDKLLKAAQTALTKFSWWRVDTVDGLRVALALPAGDDPIQRSQAACYGPQKRSKIMLIIWPRTDSVCCRCLDHTWNLETLLQDTWGTTYKVGTLTWRSSFKAAGGLSSQDSYCEKKVRKLPSRGCFMELGTSLHILCWFSQINTGTVMT